MSTEKDISFIKSRLDSLHSIDSKIVTLLDNLSSTVENLKDGKLTGDKQNVENFRDNMSQFYNNLSFTSINLRKEVKILDNRINSQLNNSNLLPIQVNKKATWVNEDKMKQEIEEMDRVLDWDEEKLAKARKEAERFVKEPKAQTSQTKQEGDLPNQAVKVETEQATKVTDNEEFPTEIKPKLEDVELPNIEANGGDGTGTGAEAADIDLDMDMGLEDEEMMNV
ncbi:hypothetical protein CANARDRAFT_9328 [[Candida] arabinofermentans NRRL YB-2248]|uniref:Mediator of RNA polymerase II transcription subunit 11 n=1 Tax=[Candida] arabinofermentans NRRL YB-2248 TaxID=983967 RepID=A0A1E4SW89_9ASCO|nr:hypothetical protein CANARDRAFT_9328 [[Candida] arabinofermentans NRRL YB-2248]